MLVSVIWNPLRLGIGLVLLLFVQALTGQTAMVNGVSFVASRQEAQQQHVDPLLEVHANYAAVMPFGFIQTLDNPEVVYNTSRQWFGETIAGARQYIDLLHNNGVKVMLKPQIWIWHGEFTGDLKMHSEADWKQLEASYGKFILDFARLAQEQKVEIFCIGTELEEFVLNRPDYWSGLIGQIKKIYTGKLTYAANWDEYRRVPFWTELDYIGIDGYFPISESQTPTIEEARNGWKLWKTQMRELAGSCENKILFTEFGYRSVDYTGKEPWDSSRGSRPVNLQAQQNTLQALFQELWEEDWFAGGFIWKWFLDHQQVGGEQNNQFTPQNKPAIQVISKQYRDAQ